MPTIYVNYRRSRREWESVACVSLYRCINRNLFFGAHAAAHTLFNLGRHLVLAENYRFLERVPFCLRERQWWYRIWLTVIFLNLAVNLSIPLCSRKKRCDRNRTCWLFLNVLGFGDPYRKALTNAKEDLRQISWALLDKVSNTFVLHH